MGYLLLEILGSLIIIAIIAFALGWWLRGLKERANKPSALDSVDIEQTDDGL